MNQSGLTAEIPQTSVKARSNWKIYLLTFVVFVLGTAQFGLVGILDKVAASAGISLAVAGQLFACFSLANAIGTPLVMTATARIDRRLVLMGALVVAIVASLMTLLLSGLEALMAARALLGVATGVFYVSALSLAASLAAPGRQARAIAGMTMGFSASLILGVPIGRLIATAWDWRVIYAAIAGCCLLALFGVSRLIPSLKTDVPVPLMRQFAMLKQPKITLALLVSLLLFSGYGTVYIYLTPFVSALMPLSETGLSSLLFAYGFATLMGAQLGGFLADRLGVPRTLLSGMSLQIASLVLMAVIIGYPALTLPLLMLWGIAACSAGPVLNYNIVSLAPEASGILLSLNSSCVQLGLALGAFVGGGVTQIYPMPALAWASAGLVACAAGVAGLNLYFAQLSAKRLEASALQA